MRDVWWKELGKQSSHESVGVFWLERAVKLSREFGRLSLGSTSRALCLVTPGGAIHIGYSASANGDPRSHSRCLPD